MTFQTIQNAVLRIAPNLLTTNLSDASNVQGIVNSAYQQILRERDWMACVKQYSSTLNAFYTTGKASASNNSVTVTGFGTTWNQSHVGSFFRIGNEPAYRIESVQSTNSLTLTYTYQGTSQNSASYAISDQRIQLPTDCEYVKSIANQYWSLPRSDSAMLDASDPLRLLSGVPLCYAECGPTSAGL